MKQPVPDTNSLNAKREHNEQHTQIKELQDMLKESIENNMNLNKTFNTILPNIGTQIINNNLTINVFLNEECKNAMNITDFVDQCKLSIDDLQYTKDNGFNKGIANIFVKKLTELPLNFRPIHCSDTKTLQFYIKDDNSWNRTREILK